MSGGKQMKNKKETMEDKIQWKLIASGLILIIFALILTTGGAILQQEIWGNFCEN